MATAIQPLPRDVMVRAVDIGKRYVIGEGPIRNRTFYETLTERASAPLRRLRARARGERRERPARSEFWALRDLSLDVQRGEVLGVIGRNGAGKSTLLKVFARIAAPDTGYAQIRGRIGSLLEVGSGFHGELTGRENIYLSGAILGMARVEIDRKFDEIVAFAGTERFVDTPVKYYSSGMYLRLAFSVAAHLETDVVLVDEVLAVGDAEFQKKCLGKMGEVAGEGRTVLLVSHQMNAIQGLCQRVVVLDQGRIVHAGPTDSAVQYYLSSYRREVEQIPLAARSDRRGSGALRFESASFRDPATRQPLPLLLAGQPVLIELGYRRGGAQPTGSVAATISFWADTGQFLFACDNEAVGTPLSGLGESGVLRCLLPKWPLASGVYTFNLQAITNGVLADELDMAGQIAVEQGDYYGTGRIPLPSHKGLFVDYQWLPAE